MTPEQINAAILAAIVYVVVQLVRTIGNVTRDILQARSRRFTATVEGQATGIEVRSATEQMGIAYMQQLVADNKSLREENKATAEQVATLNERIRAREEAIKASIQAREEQLTMQSQLKVEAIQQLNQAVSRAENAEKEWRQCTADVQKTAEELGRVTAELTTLTGKYQELHDDSARDRETWHEDRNTWMRLDAPRQTEVQRARFLLRQLSSRLTDDQRVDMREVSAAKGFDFETFVEAAGSLEMAQIEALLKENEELKTKLGGVTSEGNASR
jgi:chromosome segregation ATPase